MKSYRCMKRVDAFKIAEVSRQGHMCGATLVGSTGDTLVVSQDFINKHSPYRGGYLVKYKDGYCSFSPPGAFESGYEEVTNG